jgi:hypothetical protein
LESKSCEPLRYLRSVVSNNPPGRQAELPVTGAASVHQTLLDVGIN